MKSDIGRLVPSAVHIARRERNGPRPGLGFRLGTGAPRCCPEAGVTVFSDDWPGATWPRFQEKTWAGGPLPERGC